MFAIIDIEGTGGNPKKDRITEIAIFIHNGKRVIEQYCTLVNPQQYISPFITALTGITNEMVAEAPTWEEIAPKVKELTEGRVFVAHNVRFDYSFISNEFKRIGQRYVRKQLCTVRLSRAILPGLQSYSLGRLCDQVGIPVEHRHRAFGDGAATAELFNVLLQHDRYKMIQDALKDEIHQSIMPPNLRREILDDLPEDTGIYYFRDERGKILYIGKSTNIRQRVISHFSGDMNSQKYHELKSKIHSIDFELTGNELVALLLESHEIKRWMPPFNTAQRRKKYRYGLYKEYDAKGYLNLKVSLLKLDAEPVFAVSSRRGAEGMLMSIAEKHNLCLSKCDIDHESEDGCVNYHAGLCKGACLNEETAEAYNDRVTRALHKYQYEKPDFIIVGEGRKPQERSVICVENGQYLGYGFFDEPMEQSYSFEEIKQAIKPFPDHPDLHKIIRSFVKKNRKHHEVVYRPSYSESAIENED
jgi:DNA polymerase-3 subunit epsilon